MKKKTAILLLTAALTVGMLAGCGKSQQTVAPNNPTSESQKEESQATTPTEESKVESPAATEAPVENHEGMYRSELTNEWIDEALENQRPVAILVDNEKTALDHYGLTQADIVYELMNSTANGEITRFMAIVKDWNSITRFGSIRSVRPTNFMLAPEYDAVLVHDGGPFYVDAYLKNPWIDNLSGGFARIENGKPREFTEYVTTGEIASRLKANKISEEYTSYYQGAHWLFAEETAPMKLMAARSDAKACTFVDLPFPHNESELEYDADSNTYLYSEYGAPHIDLENDKKQLAFTNIVLQCAEVNQLDANGYLEFKLFQQSGKGYYITGGAAIPVTWEKGVDYEPTKFYDMSGNEIILNTGKTYVGLVSTDRWDELVLK